MTEPIYSRPSDDTPTPDRVKAVSNVQAAPDVPAAPSSDHAKRGLSRSARRNRQVRRLREENEMLHRRLAAIYGALTLD